MIANCLTLAGVICKPPRHSQSPAGIKHVDFVLEHKSEQVEANLPRSVYCRIQVIISGEAAQAFTDKLTMGNNVQVQGFLNRHETRNGTAKLVLHAHNVEILN